MDRAGRSAIEIWQGSVAESAGEAVLGAGVLSPGERERAARFRFERDRTSYIVAHVALRRVLARRIGCAPAEVAFRESEFGKPSLAVAGLDGLLDFNLSHSGDRVAIAVTDGLPVGIDVEAAKEMADPLELAERFFSAPEAIYVKDGARPGGMLERFLRVWTAKEAFIKQRGMGLSMRLDSFSVAEPFSEISPVRLEDGSLLGKIVYFAAGPGCQGAVYADDVAARLEFRDFSELRAR